MLRPVLLAVALTAAIHALPAVAHDAPAARVQPSGEAASRALHALFDAEIGRAHV